MMLIIDANELFSFFNKKSRTRELSLLPALELYAPSYALEEIEKYRKDIMKKFNLSDFQFETIENFLHVVVKFMNVDDYKEHIAEAQKLSPDQNDIDYFALALKLNCPIWSEDKELKKQDKVKIYSTGDLVKEFGMWAPGNTGLD